MSDEEFVKLLGHLADAKTQERAGDMMLQIQMDLQWLQRELGRKERNAESIKRAAINYRDSVIQLSKLLINESL